MGSDDQGVTASEGRWRVVPRTLCFVTHGDDVLLLKGAPDKRIYPGKYNGVGGHVERNEDVLTAVRREVREETGLEVDALRLCGVAHVDAGHADMGIGLFIFTAQSRQRETAASREGSLEWHTRDDLPENDLVEDLPIILPRVLDMRLGDPPFFAHYHYDETDSLSITFSGELPVSRRGNA